MDIKRLDFHDRIKIVERLVKNTEEENEKFLLKLRNRIDRYVLSFFCHRFFPLLILTYLNKRCNMYAV